MPFLRWSLSISQNAFALGELFIGHKDSGGYSVEAGVPDGKDAPGFGFTLTTPNRVFYLSAESKEDMDKWIDSLQKVMETPLTPQDSRCKYISSWRPWF